MNWLEVYRIANDPNKSHADGIRAAAEALRNTRGLSVNIDCYACPVMISGEN